MSEVDEPLDGYTHEKYLRNISSALDSILQELSELKSLRDAVERIEQQLLNRED